MRLPAEHPQRIALNQEIHARPPEAMRAPGGVAYLVMYVTPEQLAAEQAHMTTLLEAQGHAPPAAWTNHFSVELEGFLLKWERHTEFSRYTLISEGEDAAADPGAPLERLGADWLEGLPGELLFAARCSIVAARSLDEERATAREQLSDSFVGASVSGNALRIFTDFDFQSDDANLFLINDVDANPLQLGRVVQRVLELNTYWIMALLALTPARSLHAYLSEQEARLQDINQALEQRSRDDGVLLEELIALEADLGRRAADNAFRFSASNAYYRLVESRVRDLREERIKGLQTFSEFAERRLAPAMNTCESAENRLNGLLERASHATRLIATRVNLAQAQQNQEVLSSLDVRAKLQLRLQQTVEGLSIAAITYYVVGLVSYGAGSLATLGVPLDPKLTTGLSIPVVALLVGLGIRRVRRSMEHDD